jgi:signal transduction histidine kinase
MNKNFSNKALVFGFVICLLVGLLCSYLSMNMPNRISGISFFQSQLNNKELIAEKQLDKLVYYLNRHNIHSCIHFASNSNVDNGIVYYIYNQYNQMVYWSESNLNLSLNQIKPDKDWSLITLPNMYTVGKCISTKKYKVVALIPIKNNYSYQNQWIDNTFTKDFHLSKRIRIVNGSVTDQVPIYSNRGNYMFSFVLPESYTNNREVLLVGIISYALVFILFFILYVRLPKLINWKNRSLKFHILIVFIVGIAVGILLYLNIPKLLFENSIFTPFQYASGRFFASVAHLTVITSYFIASVAYLYFNINSHNIKSKFDAYLLLLLYVFYFGVLIYVIHSLCVNSTIKLFILTYNDFSVLSLWAHAVVYCWGVGLLMMFYKSHQWFALNGLLFRAVLFDLGHTVLLFLIYTCFLPTISHSLSYFLIVISLSFVMVFYILKRLNMSLQTVTAMLIFALFFIYHVYDISTDKAFEKYKVLADIISVNGNLGTDKMTEVLLVELSDKLLHDHKIPMLVQDSNSLKAAENYLVKKYFLGFLNKYEIKVLRSSRVSEFKKKYNSYLQEMGTKIEGTIFYQIDANARNLSYVAEFGVTIPGLGDRVLYLELYPRSQNKSYSFPDLLIPNGADVEKQLKIGIAKYDNGQLVYATTNYSFPLTTDWIPVSKSNCFKVVHHERMNYIFTKEHNIIVISPSHGELSKAYWVLFFYFFLIYIALTWLLVWGCIKIYTKSNFNFGLSSKFQFTFIVLLIVSFICIFYASINYIDSNFKSEQIANLKLKKNYIQKALQEQYYWQQDLKDIDPQLLMYFIQELSFTFETDIMIYDNSGKLIASSQPLLFDKQLLSNRISPKAFFFHIDELNQQEHIGKLTFLTGYTDLVNGDFLQMGYVCIPQFYSHDQLKNKIEEFISVIVHIYILIILLVIIISLIVSKQLSAPLTMLELKLAQMKIGSRNEKIEYSQNDQIGQLVNQYNKTIDELDKSAQLLAQSERESAWKLMARQVAHEINNPLTPMKLTIQQLQRTKNMDHVKFDDYFNKSTHTLIEQIDNLSNIASAFSNFAKMPEAKFESFDLVARLKSVIQLFTLSNDQLLFEDIIPDCEVIVHADPEQLIQVFNNLIKNAIQSIPQGRNGIIQFELNKLDDSVIISVTDNGNGIDESIVDKIFVPNFTTKSSGMGLGLAISKNIVEVAGGSISFNTKKNIGTCFSVQLPLPIVN